MVTLWSLPGSGGYANERLFSRIISFEIDAG